MAGFNEKKGHDGRRLTARIVALAFLALFLAACTQLEKPRTEPFYAETAPPKIKEFRWSNGRLPKTLDPARAVAPPETDLVRAVYEGLTDTDPKTLQPVPAVAEKWTASEDFRVWTFQLRRDATWSNGNPLTASDFVRSWQRALALGDKVLQRRLFANIMGAKVVGSEPPKPTVPADLLKPVESPKLPIVEPVKPTRRDANSNANVRIEKEPRPEKQQPTPEKTPEEKLGVEALGDFALRVTLRESDRDFPALVAHPLFRPVHGDGAGGELDGGPRADVVTSGAFRILSVDESGVLLERAENYWDRAKIDVERVHFVPTESAEKALDAYRRGDVDAVTNVDFEPLALKLLTPYDDFKRKTHGALNFYEFNTKKKPFDDRRVREALAISIDRERLTEIETDGSARPALTFLPFDDEKAKRIVQDKERAKELLAEAGFESGEDFPVVRLVVNRNDAQQRIARAVVKMWKQALGIDVIVEVREGSEVEAARLSGDYELLRRGVVIPTRDELAGLSALFPALPKVEPTDINGIFPAKSPAVATTEQTETRTITIGPSAVSTPEDDAPPLARDPAEGAGEAFSTEAEALAELPAIPLYFPTSYSLVKPYVQGFEINSLDAPSLKNVRIDNDWQPKKPGGES